MREFALYKDFKYKYKESVKVSDLIIQVPIFESF